MSQVSARKGVFWLTSYPPDRQRHPDVGADRAGDRPCQPPAGFRRRLLLGAARPRPPRARGRRSRPSAAVAERRRQRRRRCRPSDTSRPDPCLDSTAAGSRLPVHRGEASPPSARGASVGAAAQGAATDGRASVALRSRWHEWYGHGSVYQAFRVVRRAKLARVLRFYADKARRHGLTIRRYQEIVAEIDRMVERGADYAIQSAPDGDRGWVFCPEYAGREPLEVSPAAAGVRIFLFGPGRLPDADFRFGSDTAAGEPASEGGRASILMATADPGTGNGVASDSDACSAAAFKNGSHTP